MGWYGDGRFPRYVPVAERRAAGKRALDRLVAARGRPADPVVVDGRAISRTFWGRAWCDNLERYSDLASRLPRGRSYVRSGAVVDLSIEPGRVEAVVAGTELYQVRIELVALAVERWREVVAACAGKVGSLVDLLRGELPPAVLDILCDRDRGLFPAPRQIRLACSCPDWARMCKHIAAVLYGVGARLDQRPELFFTLRQVDSAELIAHASAAEAERARRGGGSRRLAGADLGALFGIDLEPERAPRPRPAKARAKAKAKATVKAKARAKAKAKATAKPKARASTRPPARRR
jgi:uncharacterized Zn finger protein